MDERSRALYVISVAADLAGMHAQTLRIYEREGLLEPQRTAGGSRRYSESDVRVLKRIKDLSDSGVSREGIRLVLDLEAKLASSVRRIRELELLLDDIHKQAEQQARDIHQSYRAEIVPFRVGALVVKKTGGSHGS